jgi:preprotein translocase subunit SecD
LLAGLILFQFGTGPVKGFAVTLSVGIVTTLFTAMFITRLIYDAYMARHHVERLSI